MISNLYIALMASPNRLQTVQVLLTTPDYDWERVDFWVNEGPAVIKRNGRIFLTYLASATGACYCMGMLSASEEADLLDPASWTNKCRPVLASEESLGIRPRPITPLPRMRKETISVYIMPEKKLSLKEIPGTIPTGTRC